MRPFKNPLHMSSDRTIPRRGMNIGYKAIIYNMISLVKRGLPYIVFAPKDVLTYIHFSLTRCTFWCPQHQQERLHQQRMVFEEHLARVQALRRDRLWLMGKHMFFFLGTMVVSGCQLDDSISPATLLREPENNHWLGSFFIRFSLFLFQFWIGKPMKPWCSTLKKIPYGFSLGILVGDELHSKVTRRHPWPGRYWRSAKGEAAFRGMKTEGYVGCGHKWPPEACWSHHFWVVFNRFVECFGRMC